MHRLNYHHPNLWVAITFVFLLKFWQGFINLTRFHITFVTLARVENQHRSQRDQSWGVILDERNDHHVIFNINTKFQLIFLRTVLKIIPIKVLSRSDHEEFPNRKGILFFFCLLFSGINYAVITTCMLALYDLITYNQKRSL